MRVDVCALVQYLRARQPALFAALASLPATLQKVHYKRERPVHMVYRRPHVALDNVGHITGLFWAPPFEGPPLLAPHHMDLYFDAYLAYSNAVQEFTTECVAVRCCPWWWSRSPHWHDSPPPPPPSPHTRIPQSNARV